VLGFVDNNKKIHKTDLGVTIFDHLKGVPLSLRSLGGEVLIIADKELTKEDLLTVADDCLKYNFKMYSVPSIIGCVNKEIFCKSKDFQIMDLLGGNSIVIDKNRYPAS
jgi:FlaA1/EpsC-like NDP-sugar epimerase